ncbi:MAG: D-tyrosyl-tRNA(Tyr) deacylase [Microgenomates group bacterium GW2011_GWC1_37_12b]|uniref:D-aminoacyl-tRNA deacylase n=1 Tax=Candidatus Woesebacteria bacterium GW2011_GWB1_38_8b TaxID=1618571 RepID=A0A0G0L8E3_9BACT|nr:MAG: D-tyrosyl-tRNA(Tyr) deacylase [Microgenomates group bacterium GW2011_GWC1_37_12b]KKQ87262.1 MAG: D-tyrosyl-tRNA(Tyr) deacylase [Candidatus Woesebacteria bacterium GW2011_GWB1_38_8b]
MKLVVQRVSHAKVTDIKKKQVIGEIGKGLFILLGVGKGDSEDETNSLAQKVLKLRIMADENDKMNLSVVDTKSEILVVSQFTLYADTNGGNRPSFINSEEPNRAKEIYEYFVNELRESGLKVETGSFGEYMEIDAQLDGPVTIIYGN